MKKIQKKARLDNKAGGNDAESDEKKPNVKEEEQSKCTHFRFN